MKPPSKGHGAPSARIPILLVALGIVAVLASVVLLWPRKDPKVARERAAPSSKPSLDWAPTEALVTEPEVAQRDGVKPSVTADAGGPSVGAAIDPASAVVDLFSAPGSELITRAHDIVEQGGRLHSRRLRELVEYSKANPTDARPQLLLALDSMNRKWYAFATSHYVQAMKANPLAARDPHVLEDLVTISGRKHDSEKAREAVTTSFGRGALPALRAAMERATADNDPGTFERLQELVTTIEAQKPAP